MAGFQFLAALAATLFAGAAIYVNLAEHPARMECGATLAATVFGPSYRRGAVMQAVLALVATGAGTGAWLTGGSGAWLLGAILIFLVVPFTLVVIKPTNNQLLGLAVDRAARKTGDLLRLWGRLHAVRSALSLASSIVFLAALVWRRG